MERIEHGFTTIELMVVMGVVSIIAAIATPNIMSMQDRAKDASVVANARNVQLAVENYKILNGGNKPTGFTTAVAKIPTLEERLKSYYTGLFVAYADENRDKQEAKDKGDKQDKKKKDKEDKQDKKDKDKEDKQDKKDNDNNAPTTPTTPTAPANSTGAPISMILQNPYNTTIVGAAAINVGTGTGYAAWTAANRGQVCYDLAGQTSPYYIAGQGKVKTVITLTEGQ